MRTAKTALLAALLAGLLFAVAGPAVAEVASAETVVAAAQGEEPAKHQFPLDLETAYGVFGLFLLACLILAGVFGLRNAIHQLRGERPQSDGSWRPR